MNLKSPVYAQLADLLRDKIEKGIYTFGMALPSERQIAEQYGINRLTVRRALDVLTQEGLLIRHQGKGTFIRTPKIISDFENFEGWGEFLVKQGLSVTNKVLFSGRRCVGYKYSKIFGLDEKDEIFQLVRLRMGDGEPFALEYVNVPCAYVPDFEQYDYTVYLVSDLYPKHKIEISDNYQKLEIVAVHDPQAKLLNVPENSNIFLLTEILKDQSGRTVEYTRTYHSGEKFSYSTKMV